MKLILFLFTYLTLFENVATDTVSKPKHRRLKVVRRKHEKGETHLSKRLSESRSEYMMKRLDDSHPSRNKRDLEDYLLKNDIATLELIHAKQRNLTDFANKWTHLRRELVLLKQRYAKDMRSLEDTEERLQKAIGQGSVLAQTSANFDRKSKETEATMNIAMDTAKTKLEQYRSGLEEQEQKLETKEIEAMTGDIPFINLTTADNSLELQEEHQLRESAYRHAKVQLPADDPEGSYFAGENEVFHAMALQEAEEADSDLISVDRKLNQLIRKRIQRSANSKKTSGKKRKSTRKVNSSKQNVENVIISPRLERYVSEVNKHMPESDNIAVILSKNSASPRRLVNTKYIRKPYPDNLPTMNRHFVHMRYRNKREGDVEQAKVDSEQAAKAEKEAEATSEAEATKEAEAGKEAEAAKEAEATSAAEATKEAEAAKEAETVKEAEADKEVEAKNEKTVAKDAEKAKDADAADAADAAKEAETAKEEEEKHVVDQVKDKGPTEKDFVEEPAAEPKEEGLVDGDDETKTDTPEKGKTDESNEKTTDTDNEKVNDESKDVEPAAKNKHDKEDEHTKPESNPPDESKENISPEKPEDALEEDKDYSDIEEEMDQLLREKIQKEEDEPPEPKKSKKQLEKEAKEKARDQKEVELEDWALHHENRIRLGPLERDRDNVLEHIHSEKLHEQEVRMESLDDLKLVKLAEDVESAEKELQEKLKKDDDENMNLDTTLSEIQRDFKIMDSDEKEIVKKFQKHAKERKKRKLKRQKEVMKGIKAIKQKEKARIDKRKQLLPKKAIAEDETVRYDIMIAKVMEGWV